MDGATLRIDHLCPAGKSISDQGCQGGRFPLLRERSNGCAFFPGQITTEVRDRSRKTGNKIRSHGTLHKENFEGGATLSVERESAAHTLPHCQVEVSDSTAKVRMVRVDGSSPDSLVLKK
jgi:hypothetical protein